VKRRRSTFKRNGNGTGSASNYGRTVRQLAAEGLSGDVIAARLGVNMNTLRAQHALHLKAGRDCKAAEKAEAEVAELSKSEQARVNAIKQTFNSHWYTKEKGNLLFGGTHSLEEALEWSKRNGGGHWK
jgi:hypothetical protein